MAGSKDLVDDLDDLLAELDMMTSSRSEPSQTQKQQSPERNSNEEEVIIKHKNFNNEDDLEMFNVRKNGCSSDIYLDMFDKADGMETNLPISEGSKQVVIGGSGVKKGTCGSVIRKVVSGNIKCLNCDLAVNRWEGYMWADEADYLFFRNNAPDRSRMSSKLKPKKTHAAYACQCAWLSVETIQRINLGDSVGGHYLNWVSS